MAFEIEFYSSEDGRVPVAELKLAKERRADWLSRHKEG